MLEVAETAGDAAAEFDDPVDPSPQDSHGRSHPVSSPITTGTTSASTSPCTDASATGRASCRKEPARVGGGPDKVDLGAGCGHGVHPRPPVG